jgi:integrase
MSHISVVHDQAVTWSAADQIAEAAGLLATRNPTPPTVAPIIKLVPRPTPARRPIAPATPDVLLDRTGRPRTAATTPGHRKGQAPVSKGRRYPPDPVTPDDVNRMLRYLEEPRGVSENRHGEMSRLRLRALIALLWRSGLRISEALDLELRDLNRDDLCITVRHGKGDKRRISAMDEWGWAELQRWLTARASLPSGPVFCVVSGVTAGQRWAASDVRRQMSTTAKAAGVTRRVAPHQFRHAHAVDLWRDGIDVFVVQRQLGHARLDVTAHYLSSVSPVELLDPIGRRRAPLMPVAHSTGPGPKARA